jgi:hypothetical protein
VNFVVKNGSKIRDLEDEIHDHLLGLTAVAFDWRHPSARSTFSAILREIDGTA